jgi:hypothetical protein
MKARILTALVVVLSTVAVAAQSGRNRRSVRELWREIFIDGRALPQDPDAA